MPDPKIETTDTAPEGFTEEEWAGLSETEREGIVEGLNDPEETGDEEEIDEDLLKDIVGDEEKPGEADDEEKPVDEGGKEADPEKPGEEEKPEALTDEDLINLDIKVQDTELPADITKPPATILEERTKKLSELTAERKQKLSDLEKEYDDGDITDDDYEARKEALYDEYQDKRDDIRDEYTAQIVSATQEQKNEAIKRETWTRQQNVFFTNKPEYLGEKQADGTYKHSDKSAIMYGALSQAIGRIEAEKPGQLSGMQLLIEADKVVKSVMGVTQPAPVKPAKPGSKIPDVKTLSEVPAAHGNETGTGWEALDKLSGAAYEKALERLSPEQRDAYLNAR